MNPQIHRVLIAHEGRTYIVGIVFEIKDSVLTATVVSIVDATIFGDAHAIRP